MEKLKPCPFCGGEAEVVRWRRGESTFAFGKCRGRCHAVGEEIICGPVSLVKAEELAAAAWNRRASDPALAQARQALKDAARSLRTLGRAGHIGNLLAADVSEMRQYAASRADAIDEALSS